MDRRSHIVLRSILVGYIALLTASLLIDSPLLGTAVDLGFAAVAGFFAYVIYTDRSPSDDRRLVIGSAGALVAAVVAQVLALLPGLAAAGTVSTALFILGFLGYFVLRRR